MTAISVAYVKAGFAVVADGRCRWSSEGETDNDILKGESDAEQKIFAGSYKGQPFAYTLTGAVFDKTKTFSLIDEMKDAGRAHCAKPFINLGASMEGIANHLKNALMAARADGRIQEFPDMDVISPGVIATVFLVGYFRKGKPPSLVTIRLTHRNQLLSVPEIEIQSPPARLLRAGSLVILDLIDNRSDDRFSEFYRPQLRLESALEDAISWGRAYVDACCSEAAREVDPKVCDGIGGHVHIATVTQYNGFQWVVPPITTGDSSEQ